MAAWIDPGEDPGKPGPRNRSNSRRKFITGACKRRKPYLPPLKKGERGEFNPFIKREFRISKSNDECRRKESLRSVNYIN